MRILYEQQLKELHNSLILMGALCEHSISLSVHSFLTGNVEDAEKVIKVESDIDDKYAEIEKMCLKLLLKQTPVASDFRTVSSALKMVTDLERIGDQSCDIAELVKFHGLNEIAKIVKEMAIEATTMVTNAIDAFVKSDIEIANDVVMHDDIVDKLFLKARQEIVENIKNATDSVRSEEVVDALMVAKYLERIGDHATNIAEWAIYSITGEHKDSNTSSLYE